MVKDHYSISYSSALSTVYNYSMVTGLKLASELIEGSVGEEFGRTVGRTLNIHQYALFLDAGNGLFNADIL
jgi:thiosulfate reductase cytochrome b subunit